MYRNWGRGRGPCWVPCWFQVNGGVRTETKAPPRKGRVGTYFSLCIGFHVRRATFQNKPQWQWAEHVTAKKGKKQQETTTRLSKLRRRRKNKEQKKDKWHSYDELSGAGAPTLVGFHVVSVLCSTNTPGGTQRGWWRRD